MNLLNFFFGKPPEGKIIFFNVLIKDKNLKKAANLAIKRWDTETQKFGIRLKPKKPLSFLAKLGDKTNQIYFKDITIDNRWADAPVRTNIRNEIVESDVRLDASKPYGFESVYRVCLHEIGHCLGIPHIPAEGVKSDAIMAYDGPARISDIRPLDIVFLRKLLK
jgi:hypothetical protein